MKIAGMLTLLFALGVAPALADPVIYGRDDTETFSHLTLRGIEAVAVQVVGVDAGYRSYGIDEAGVRRRVVERLEAAGIHVLTREQAIAAPRAALLQLNVYATMQNWAYYSYAVLLRLKQKVALPNDPEAFISSTVWSDKAGGVLIENEFRKLLVAVDEVTDHFIAAYRAQNSR